TPGELVQRARIAVPGAEIRVGEVTALAACQIHALDLEAGLCRRTLHRGGLSVRVLDRRKRRLRHGSHAERRALTPLDVDLRRLRGKPLRDDRPEQSLQMPTPLPAEDRFQRTPLIAGGRI